MIRKRYDFIGSAENIEETPQGFVRVDARLSRTGIFSYKCGSKIVRELRPAEEVFKIDSLSSIAGAPITNLHPAEFVGPENAKDLLIGFAGEEIKQDGEFVSAKLTITAAQAIAALKDGTRKEISLGYACELDETPGEHQGQRYDAIQRNIVINHIALGPVGWGRAGPQCAIKLDNNDAIQIKEDNMEENKEPSAVESLGRELKEKREMIESLKGRVDALSAELIKEKKLRIDAEDPALVEQKVAGRLSLLEKCRAILGDVNLDGKTDREIKEAVIKKENPEFEVDGKDDAYIDGMFEALVSLRANRNDSLASAHMAASQSYKKDSLEPEKARANWTQRAQNLWQKPLAGSL